MLHQPPGQAQVTLPTVGAGGGIVQFVPDHPPVQLQVPATQVPWPLQVLPKHGSSVQDGQVPMYPLEESHELHSVPAKPRVHEQVPLLQVPLPLHIELVALL